MLMICTTFCTSLSLALLATPHLPDGGTPVSVKAAPAPAYLSKIAIVGANISADFGLRDPKQPKSSPTRGWTMLVDGSIMCDHETLTLASGFLFANPAESLSKQLDKAKSAKATTIIGLDALFWFAYGQRPEAERMAFFERGLTLLDTVQVPLVVGDIPALKEGPMLMATMIPSPETIEALNTRLAAWSKPKTSLALVPLRKAAEAMQAGTEIQAWGHRFPTKGGPPVLQPDQLHTTFHGSLALWCLTLDSWRTIVPEDQLFVVQQSPGGIQMALNWRFDPDVDVVDYKPIAPDLEQRNAYPRSKGLRKVEPVAAPVTPKQKD